MTSAFKSESGDIYFILINNHIHFSLINLKVDFHWKQKKKNNLFK